MATEITINGTLTLDQTSGLQDDDDAIGNNVAGDPSLSNLSEAFINFLGDTSLTALNVNVLTAAQKDFADDVEAVISGANFVTVTQNSATISDLFFSDANGDPLDGDQVFLADGVTPLQTVDGDNIYLWSFGDFVLATTSSDPGDKGDVVAAFYLNEANNHLSASIEYVTFIPLAHPDDTDPDDTVDWTEILNISASASLSFEFDNLRSGKFLWVALGDGDNGLLLTGEDLNVQDLGTTPPSKVGERVSGGQDPSDAVNTSQGGVGATTGINEQMYKPGATGVFTLVTGFVPLSTSTTGEAAGDKVQQIDYGAYINTTGAGIFISQTSGGDPIDLTIEVFEAGGGTTPEEGFAYIGTEGGNDGTSGAFADDTAVNVKTVTVLDGTGAVVGTWGTGGAASGTTIGGVTVTISSNSITVDGIFALYTVKWTVVDGETFNRFHVTANPDSEFFDIGRVDIDQGVTITEPVGDKLFVDDDGPTAALDTTAAVVTLDETDDDDDDPDADGSLADVTTPVATLFSDTSAFGTDGGKDADDDGTVDDDATTYSLVLNGDDGVASGLIDTATGNAINLYKVSDTEIEGRVDTDGNGSDETVAFEIIVTNDPDNVQVIQWRAVVHDDFPDDHDESDDPETMDPNLVLLRTTVIDDDGDEDSDDAELGSRINFEDDGPEAAIAPEDVMIVIDETDNAGENATDETDAAAPADDHLGTVTISGADLFNHTGEAAGSDGEFDPARAYELALASEGADSGFVDTATGEDVLLFTDGDDVVGLAGADGPEVMRISIDADNGDVTVTLKRAVVHDDASDPDESTSPEVMNSGVLFLKYTLTDGDQDEDDAQFDLGELIKIEDDGPSVTVSADASGAELEAIELEHDETIAPDDPAGEDTYNEPGTGDDDPANRDNNGDSDDTGETAVTVATAPANNQAIGMLMTDGSGEIGALFGVEADFGSDGEGDLDTTDGRTDTLSLVLRDGSGEPVETLETNLKVTALEGTALEGLGEAARTIWLVQVDDTTVEGRIPGTDGALGTGDDDYVAFRIELENETDLDTAKLVTHHFLPIDHGGSEDPSVFDEEAELATVDENATLSIRLVTEVEDGDDDTDDDDAFVPIVDNEGGFLQFDDDGPTAVITDTGEEVVHDESPGLQNAGAPDFGPGTPDPETGEDNDDDDRPLGTIPAAFAALGTAIGWALSPTAVVSSEGTDFGTDGEAAADAVLWSLAVPGDDTDSGFDTLDGHNILLNVESVDIGGGTFVDVVVGRIDDDDNDDVDSGDDVAIAIMIDQDGKLSVAQYVMLKHPDGSDPDDAAAMNDEALLAVLTVTDGDGDVHEVTEPIGDKVVIEDHGPVAQQLEPVTMEEDDLDGTGTQLSTGNDNDPNGDPNDGAGDDSGTRDSVTIDVENGIVDPGDEPVSYSLRDIDPDTVLPVLFSKGEQLDYERTGNKIEAFAGTRLVFTFTLVDNGDGTADATLTLNDQLDHVPFGDDVENVLLMTDPNDPDGDPSVSSIDFTDMIDIRDADDDPVALAPEFVSYEVQDDRPEFTDEIEGGTVDFAAGDSITRSLNGAIGTDDNDADNEALDGTKTYTFASFTESFLIDRDGTESDVLIRGVLSDDGTVVEYFEDLDGDPGTDDFGDMFYRITLDQTANDGAGSYIFEVLKDPPPAFLEFDFTDLPSGQNLHGTIAADKTNPDGLGLLVFPKGAILDNNGIFVTGKVSSPTLNTSKGGGPVTIGNTNQMIDPLEGMYFAFVDNPDNDSIAGIVGGLDQNTADDADEVGFADTFTSTTSSVEIVQVQGNGLASLDIFAWDITLADPPLGDGTNTAPGAVLPESREFVTDPRGGTATSSATAKNITEVKVYDGLGNDATLIFHATESGGELLDVTDNISASFGGDEVRLTGIDDDYRIEFTTDGGHDLVLVQGVAGKFDIGGFNIAEAQPTPDQLYEFEVTITDFDGDTDTSNQFSITVDGTGVFDSGEFEDGIAV